MEFLVYKIINSVNNKIYIGITAKPLEIRWRNHILDSRHKSKRKHPFYMDILKYGYINFDIELIEICESEQHMQAREAFWIQQMQSLFPNGYNLNRGFKLPEIQTLSPMKQTIEENIKSHLKDKGLKLDWLRNKLDISNSHLSNMLNGVRTLTPEVVNKINNVLGTDFRLNN